MAQRLLRLLGRGLSILGALLVLTAVFVMFEPLIAMAYFPAAIDVGLQLLIIGALPALIGRLISGRLHDDWFWRWNHNSNSTDTKIIEEANTED